MKQWRSLEEYKGTDEPVDSAKEENGHREEVLELLSGPHTNGNANRRDFLKLLGFTFASAALVKSCEKPVHKAIPYLIKPEEVVPGKASYYASSFFDGTEYCPVLVKVRDGRPVKIEANKLAPVSGNGTSARVQASVLGLYDEARYREPSLRGNIAGWDQLDETVRKALSDNSGGRTVLMTSTIISPSTKALIREFLQSHPGLEHVVYDETDVSAIRQAHKKIMGRSVIPGYHFDKARLLLSFEADFLATWLMPVSFAGAYATGRDLTGGRKELSRHIQVESGLSVTGSHADQRIPAGPVQQEALLRELFGRVAEASGHNTGMEYEKTETGKALADELLKNRGSSLVISGLNNPVIQEMVVALNYLLDNYGSTIDIDRDILLKQGGGSEAETFFTDLAAGKISRVIFFNVNPVYSHPEGSSLAKAIAGAGLSVYIGSAWNETAASCDWIAPDHHYLEAWGDAEPVTASYSLQQPCINPLYNTRSFQDSLLKWMGKDTGYQSYLTEYWEKNIYPGLAGGSFRKWWTVTLRDGAFEKQVESGKAAFNLPEFGDPVFKDYQGFALTLYAPVAVNDGRHANNPWLMELPDPVSLVCWDNYLAVSAADAAKEGFVQGDVLEVDGVELPALIQPGQAPGTVSLALGYGRQSAGKVADGVGVNGFRFVSLADGYRGYYRLGVSVGKTGKNYQLAMTQTHHSMEGRPIVQNTSLEAYLKDSHAGNQEFRDAEFHSETLYPEVKFDGFHWGLVVDLNKCVSCNNCIVSCIAENNIATVGRDEVRNRRIMHWLRIDRYYEGEPENPKVLHQPVMCQHCDNAPCENVCPVSATMHSNEGLNQVAYIRCIGTKYCINNCPYRVRRFNWFRYVKNDRFNYHLNSDLSRLVLNPDVTVRERGVVEKCSFCVQRIQEKKLEAKLEGRVLNDGDIQPACVQSCPTGALVFGDMNNPGSRVSTLIKEDRSYHLLQHLHTLPSVSYLTRVINNEEEEMTDNHA
ncbi:MAG: TAT-variant-translocated molybdopterin oxidoreductase [Bacteroidota bacterium]